MSNDHDPLVVVPTKIPWSVRNIIDDLAADAGSSRSAVIRELLVEALGSGKSSEDRGYNDGLRQGLHEAREAITAALADQWK